MLLVVFLAVFGAVSLAAWAVFQPKDRTIERRVLPVGVNLTRERRLEGSLYRRSVAPFVRGLGRQVSKLLPQTFVARIEAMIGYANLRWSLSGFFASWLMVVLIAVAFAVWVLGNAGATPLQSLVLLVALVPIPSLIPYAVLRRRAKNRQKAITLALPDALDLLVTSVEAGMGADAAFALVAEQSTGPLAEVFSGYLRQVGLGRSRREALAYMAERTGVADLDSLASTVIQGEDLGTSLGDVLRRHAEDLRLLRAQRARERAQRAPVLMTSPLVLCFMPAMFCVVVVPSVLHLTDFVDTTLGP
jgi:tight adherence protein C